MKKIIIVLILAIGLVSCAKKQNKKENIQHIVESYAAKKIFNGSILIANSDSIIFKGSYGYATLETKDSICSSTPFPIASLTKQFTSTAILLLQENKKLSITDKIYKYIEIPAYMKSVSIQNLMNHTSGIPDYWQNNIKNNNDSIWSFLYLQDSLLFTPNSDFSYSNSAYFLLGKVIEVVSGTTYANFMQTTIFQALGMKNTFVYQNNDCPKATGYNLNWKTDEYFASTADGGIISSIDDMQLWDNSIRNNSILSFESQKMMFSPVQLEDGSIKNNGFGWEIGLNQISLFEHLTGKYKGIVSHTGGLASFGAYNQYDTKTGLHIILLSNQRRPELLNLIHEINSVIY